MVKLFSAKFYLSDVLYVPHFQLNLIFVSKLTHQLKCTLTFTLTLTALYRTISPKRGLVQLKPLVACTLSLPCLLLIALNHIILLLLLIVISRTKHCGTIDWGTLHMKDYMSYANNTLLLLLILIMYVTLVVVKTEETSFHFKYYCYLCYF